MLRECTQSVRLCQAKSCPTMRGACQEESLWKRRAGWRGPPGDPRTVESWRGGLVEAPGSGKRAWHVADAGVPFLARKFAMPPALFYKPERGPYREKLDTSMLCTTCVIATLTLPSRKVTYGATTGMPVPRVLQVLCYQQFHVRCQITFAST